MRLLSASIGLGAAVAAALSGGWAWALPCVVMWLEFRAARADATALAAALAPGLLWLLLCGITGDRRLYFCYTMQYAVHLACLYRERSLRAAIGAGGVLIAVFVAVRVAQAATASVLVVEIAVSLMVLVVSLATYGTGAATSARRMAIAAVASLLAFAGLAL